MTKPNRLLEDPLSLPFASVEPEHAVPALEALTSKARANIGAISSASGPRTYENTMEALDKATEELDAAVSVVRHLESVATTRQLREAWMEAQPGVVQFYSSIPLNAELWASIKEFAATEEAAGLQGVRKRFLTKTMDNFRRHGAELPPEDKARLEAIDVELGTLTTKFAQNVLDATGAWEYIVEDEEALASLPESAVAAARSSAAQKGVRGFRFTLQQPSYLAIMTYMEDAAVREKFYRAYNTRAAEANGAIIPKVLKLRRAKAALLGYEDFAEFTTSDRMAGTGIAATSFLERLRDRTSPHFQREIRALADFRTSKEGAESRMEPWDVAYWSEKMRAALYEFDEEDLRPYFPLEQVLTGMFDLTSMLFGVEVRSLEAGEVWHPSVSHYEIIDKESGVRLARFYADWHPRETKRDGAWMDAFITGGPSAGGWSAHVGFMCGNLTPPLPDRPSLLTHREVETVFHEFGHLLHHSLSNVEVRSLSGTNVAWDFVELPSQILENWCWERESLDMFARHYRTGEAIPASLFDAMVRARTFRSANAQMRQLGFGLLDMALHRHFDSENAVGVVDAARNWLEPFAPARLPEDYAMICSFTHLFADAVGYGAGYYSYKWAEVLDADAFTRFQELGVFNPEAGMQFRRTILEKGDSEEPGALFRSFMGRDPDPDALMRRLGL